MSDETERHGHEAGDHDHDHGKAADDGLFFPFLVVLAIAVVIGWLTQPAPESATAATDTAEFPTGEPASAVAARPFVKAPPIQPAPAPAPTPEQSAVQPEQSAAPPQPSAAPGQSAAPAATAAPGQSAAAEAPAAPGEPSPPQGSAAPAPAGAAGGGAFDRIAARTALGKNARAAGRCRSAGSPAGNVRVIVAFSPDGQVSSARILTPNYIGTPTGNCILGHLEKTTIGPFAGGKPATVVIGVHVL